MPDAQQAHARFRRLVELMQARATAESNGQVSSEAVAAAHRRNAQFREFVQSIQAETAKRPRRTPRSP